jgi:hypothetical protein
MSNLNVFFFKSFLAAALYVLIGCEDQADELPPPTIASYDPAIAYPGATVVIGGTYFGTNANNVSVFFYEDVEAEITAVTNTELTVLVPDDAYQGTIRVVVSGKEVSGPEFTVLTTCYIPVDGFLTPVPCPRVKSNPK